MFAAFMWIAKVKFLVKYTLQDILSIILMVPAYHTWAGMWPRRLLPEAACCNTAAASSPSCDPLTQSPSGWSSQSLWGSPHRSRVSHALETRFRTVLLWMGTLLTLPLLICKKGIKKLAAAEVSSVVTSAVRNVEWRSFLTRDWLDAIFPHSFFCNISRRFQRIVAKFSVPSRTFIQYPYLTHSD